MAALLILAYFYQGPYQDWKDKEGETLLPGVTSEDIVAADIEKNATTTVSLTRDEEGWRLADSKEFYVAEGVGEELNVALSGLLEESVQTVSADPERKREFSVDDSGVKLVLHYGEEGEEERQQAEFRVGNVGPQPETSYVSRSEQEETYLVESPLAETVQRDRWGDPLVFDDEPEDVERVRFQYPDREFTVTREEEGWTFDSSYAGSVSSEEMEEVVNMMTYLTASDIPEQDFEDTGLDKHLIIVEASGEDMSNTLMVGEENEEGLYYAKAGKSDNIYLITEEQKDLLDRTAEDLRK